MFNYCLPTSVIAFYKLEKDDDKKGCLLVF